MINEITFTPADRKMARAARINLDGVTGVPSLPLCDYCHGREVRESQLLMQIASLEMDKSCYVGSLKRMVIESGVLKTNAEKWRALFCLAALVIVGIAAQNLYAVRP